MRFRRVHLQWLLIVCGSMLMWRPVGAGGSVVLSELLQDSEVREVSPEFTENINSELAKAQRPATGIFCTANRLGRQWENLGGERIGPYRCNVGGRTLEITTTPTFLDKQGKVLPLSAPELMKNAARVKEHSFVGKWKD